jgi:hypothetical protein
MTSTSTGPFPRISLNPSCCGLAEAFPEHQWAVFSINPKQLDRFRDRHTVAG